MKRVFQPPPEPKTGKLLMQLKRIQRFARIPTVLEREFPQAMNERDEQRE
jgi:hypothetical protein